MTTEEDPGSQGAQCPYCREACLRPDMSSCPKCQAPLPWAAVAKELRDEMKARETSRLRATATLVHEISGALSGGPRPSIQAVTGLVNAWMLPRVVLVVGSMLGGIAVVLQLFVLMKQTEVMQGQTELLARQTISTDAQLAEIYRARIARLEAVRAGLVPLYQHMENPMSPVCAPDKCPDVTIADIIRQPGLVVLTFDQDKVAREACRLPQDGEVIKASCGLSQVLWMVNQRVEPLTSDAAALQRILDPSSGQGSTAPASGEKLGLPAVGALSHAATVCALEQEQKNKLNADFIALRMLSEAYGSATSQHWLQRAAAAIAPKSLAGTPPSGMDLFKYPLQDFETGANAVMKSFGQGLWNLIGTCQKRAEGDQEALAKIGQGGK